MEKKLQAQLTSWLREIGALVVKLDAAPARGWPDLAVVLPNGCGVVFIELKHPNGKGRLHALQEYRIAELRERGVLVLVSSDLAEAKAWVLERLETGDLKGVD